MCSEVRRSQLVSLALAQEFDVKIHVMYLLWLVWTPSWLFYHQQGPQREQPVHPRERQLMLEVGRYQG